MRPAVKSLESFEKYFRSYGCRWFRSAADPRFLLGDLRVHVRAVGLKAGGIGRYVDALSGTRQLKLHIHAANGIRNDQNAGFDDAGQRGCAESQPVSAGLHV